MDSVEPLLLNLRRRGVKLWVEDGRVRYSAPGGSLLPQELTALRNSRDAVIAFLEEGPLDLSAPLQPRRRGARIPLAAFQGMLWTSMVREKEHTTLRTCTAAMTIDGQLQPNALQEALTAVTDRHESLRTRITEDNGEPRQIVDAPRAITLELTDLTRFDTFSGESELLRLSQEFVERRIAPAEGPLFAATLISLPGQRHSFILTAHQMISDGVSMDITVRDLWTAYEAALGGRTPDFPPLPCQFADYAVWQHRTRAAWCDRHEPYWKSHLHGALSSHLKLPSETPPDTPYDGRISERSLGQALSGKMRQLAATEHTLPALVLLAIYACAMFRWCEQYDLLVPFIDNGRDRPELANVAGFLAHFLLLRLRARPHDSFRDLLRHTHDEYCTACEHRDFARVSFLYDFAASTGTDLHFNWLPHYWMSTLAPNADPDRKLTVRQLSQPYPIKAGIPGQLFTPYFHERPSGIGTTVAYDAARIPTELVRRFESSIKAIATQVTENPGTHIHLASRTDKSVTVL